MGLGKFKHLTPAEEGEAAARQENYDLTEKRLKEKPVKYVVRKETGAQKPIEKNTIDDQLKQLFAAVNTTQSKIDTLIESDKKVHEEIEQEEYEFVESIEDVNTGGNIINEIIRFKHTDIVVIVSHDSIHVFESLEDYDENKEHLGIFVFEESEKVDISESNLTIKEKIKKIVLEYENNPQFDNVNFDGILKAYVKSNVGKSDTDINLFISEWSEKSWDEITQEEKQEFFNAIKNFNSL
jgi:hypothetical protein